MVRFNFKGNSLIKLKRYLDGKEKPKKTNDKVTKQKEKKRQENQKNEVIKRKCKDKKKKKI